jgi:hypothetical protein
MKFYWTIPNSDNFNTSSEWTPSSVPGAFDQVFLTGTGPFYDVNVTDSQTVLTISTSIDAILNVTNGGKFTAEAGTGSGANNGSIHVTDASFDVAGTINNHGTIELLGASLFLLGDTTLNGGALMLGGNDGLNSIIGNGMLTNAGNSDISGGATIDVPIDNKATIEANESTSDLQLNGTVTNTGEMLGDTNSGLILTTTVHNIGGLIEAATGLVQLGVPGMPSQPGTIIGGTIENLGGNFLLEVGSLDGSGTHPITVIGQINFDASTSIDVAGTFTNDGSLALNTDSSLLLGLSNAAAIDTTFSGGGQIVLTSAAIDLNPSTHVGSVPPKLNNVDDIIIGTGTIGNAVTPGSIVLNNETKGIVEAFNGALTIYSNVANAGVLDATGSNSVLSLLDSVITNTGSIKVDSGSYASVDNATIRGGTLTGAGLYTIYGVSVFDGSTAMLTNSGDLAIGRTGTAVLEGTINNTGTIDMYYAGSGGSSGDTTTLLIGATATQKQVTLTGKGTVLMDFGYSDFIEGDADVAGGGPTTLNNLNNNIYGGGRIGDGGLTLKNSGEIQGTSSTSPLVIDTGSRTVTNTGTLNATNVGELYINSPLNNSGGKLTARFGELVASQGASGGTATVSEGGIIEFGGPTTTAVQFADNSSIAATLVLDDSVHFKGVISNFAKFNIHDEIDLNDINSATAQKVSFTGGVLTVKDAAGHTAQLHFSGAYTINNFHLSDDGHGGTLIEDPPVAEQRAGNAPATIADGTVLEVKVSDSGTVTFAGPTGTLWLARPSTFTGEVADFGAQESIDLPGIPFGAHATLGYSENSSNTGGILSVKDGTHIAKLALLGNYTASSFVAAADGYGGTLITEGVQTAQQSLLTHPHV